MTVLALADLLRCAATTAVAHREDWDALDAAAGDGDFGTTMHRGFAAVLDRLPGLAAADPAALLTGVAEILSREMGGSSGPLWTIGFLRAAQALESHGTGAPSAGAALAAAAHGVAEYGGAAPGDKTLLDALRPAAEAVLALGPGAGAGEAAEAAAAAATRGARDTSSLPARRGRAAHLGERAIGRVDPGAAAVAVLATAVANQLGNRLDLPRFAPPPDRVAPAAEPLRPTKQFVNHPDHAVTEALAGYALAHPELVVWEAGDRIVRRRTASPDTVGLVSGGGSGHEPMHTGFVGEGMLTAAAPGPVFASPTVHQVLAATLAADAGRGVVHLVKNYTGDLINFGIAAELAAARGIEVQRVVVDDDLGGDDSRHDLGRRGTGATVLAEKVAGAAAQAGHPIEAVVEVATRLVARSRSFGIALGSCSPPGRAPILALGRDEIEVGVGIHGEPGRRRDRHRPAAELVGAVAGAVLDGLRPRPGARLLAMVSGLGGTTLLEQHLVYRELHTALTAAGHQVTRCLVGPYLTALDMPGVVCTVAELDEELIRLWDAPVVTAGLRWGQ